ncbi:hypothetical protein D3C79_939220 [compost metagenome]
MAERARLGGPSQRANIAFPGRNQQIRAGVASIQREGLDVVLDREAQDVVPRTFGRPIDQSVVAADGLKVLHPFWLAFKVVILGRVAE